MSDEGWPADPMDPRCPSCDEPVSATASYCMHCEADLPSGDGTTTSDGSGTTTTTTSESTTSPTELTTTTAEPSAENTTVEPTTTTDPTTTDPTTSTTESATDATDAEPSTRDDSTADATGLLDDVATLLVAAVAGVLTGIAVLVMLAFPLPGGSPFAVGFVAFLAVTVYVGRSPDVVEAVRRGGFVVAGSLALLPVLVALTGTMATNTVGQRLTALVVFGVFVWPFAAIAAGVGYAADRLFGDD